MQKLGASSAIHGSFKSFKAVDLPLRLAVAPMLSDRVSHGVDVPAQGAAEPLHRVESRLFASFNQAASLPVFLLCRIPRNRITSGAWGRIPAIRFSARQPSPPERLSANRAA